MRFVLPGALLALLLSCDPSATTPACVHARCGEVVQGVGMAASERDVFGTSSLSLAENLVTIVLPSTYRPLVPFVLLLAVLYFRPSGIFAPKGGH